MCQDNLLLTPDPCPLTPANGQGGIRTPVGITRQIYSLMPLAARPPARQVRRRPAEASGGS